ncbi:hypothetical protein C8A05DRAFT_39608 [Staphylotrichum tortipilum]|uniref:Uncharacterized protein n=1 Tax=Staphylotrichum tortipilum TaxID=2831512 RepID=A0AAN6M8Y1_9PEZI|nr:hypothetical protein C8A05DRAFT_39608 [Staphylotrichum longicolle]
MGDEAWKPPFKPDAKAPLQQIFDRLKGYFATGSSEVFQIEWPARVLDKGTYDYEGSDTINAQQVKPQSVIDAEFRLADDMITLGNVTSGPNGSRLSSLYSDVLYNLVPTSAEGDTNLDRIHADQEKITTWLLEEVSDWEPPREDILADIPEAFDKHKPPIPAAADPDSNSNKARTGDGANPIVSPKTLDVYESQRFRWATFKIIARPTNMLTATAVEIDNYNRMLATYAPIAKENLRASMMRSIDDSEDTYPVIFSPASWSKSLSTAFKPEDLLYSEDVLRGDLLAKQKERASLLLKLSYLKSAQEDVKELEARESEAREAFFKARDEMVQGYSDAAISLIQMYFDVQARNSNKGKAIEVAEDVEKGDLNKALETWNQKPITDEQFKQLKSMQATCIKNQSALQASSEALAKASLAAAMGRGSDATTIINSLNERVQSLTFDIDYMVKIMEASNNPLGVDVTVPDGDAPDTPAPEGGDPDHLAPPPAPAVKTKTLQGNPKLPPHVVPEKPRLPPQEDSASTWQEVVWTLDSSQSYKDTMASAFQSHLDWSVDFFFGSASGSEDHSEAHHLASSLAMSSEIKIGFRCMKVVIERPWFDASVLRRTHDYYRTLNIATSAMTPAEVQKALSDPYSQSDHEAVACALGPAWDSLLPSWTSAFVVAKDIHLILRSEKDWTKETADDLHSAMSAGGGFLCFSCSKSESSEEHRAAAAVAHDGQYLSIRIPAPQIIGWVQELAPKDSSVPVYNPVSDSSFGIFPVPKDSEVKPAPKPAPVPPKPSPVVNGRGAH